MKENSQEKKINLSIFFPFWNEEENIEHVVRSAIPVAERYAKNWEILMINDGSSDKTLTIANKLSHEHKNLHVITHNPNRGYGASLRDGFANAQYDYVVFTDGDGQFDFSEVDRFLEKIEQNDLVIGYRKKRQDHFVRHLFMYMLKVWDFMLFGIYFKDIDCGFKMFKKNAILQLMPLRSEGAMISTEFLAKAKIKKLKIDQVEVNHYPRKYGNESGGNLYVVIRAVLESFILWWDIRNGRI